MPNRSTKDDREVQRPRVGPADPATVRKMIAKRVAEREPASSKPAPAASAAPSSPDLDSGNISVFNVPRKIRAYKQRIDDTAQ